MNGNVLNQQTILIQQTEEEGLIEKTISENNPFDRIYSYILYSLGTEECPQGWKLSIMSSSINEYNTFDESELLKYVISNIEHPKNSPIIGFKQPPLEILVEVLEPLIASFAQKENMKWKQLEYDDLYQECYLCLCNLYNKGYFINKRLLWRTFDNKIMEIMRQHANDPVIVSTNEVISEDDEVCTIEMILRDTDAEYAEIDKTANEMTKNVYQDVCKLIKEVLGERRGDQLIKSYTTRNTDSYSTSVMLKIRRDLEKLGITRRTFNKKYGG